MLSRSLTKFQSKNMLAFSSIQMRSFAAKQEYDVAVIGGGPGGKYLFKHESLISNLLF